MAGGCLHWHLSICLSKTARLLVYLRQNSQKKSFGSLAYSWGNGLEYQVSTSYLPKTIAAGFLLPTPGPVPPGLTAGASSDSSTAIVKRFDLSRASLKRSTSFCVTPDGSVCGKTGSSKKNRVKNIKISFSFFRWFCLAKESLHYLISNSRKNSRNTKRIVKYKNLE